MKNRTKRAKNPKRPQEITAAIHYARGGPSLESCLVSILSARLWKSAAP